MTEVAINLAFYIFLLITHAIFKLILSLNSSTESNQGNFYRVNFKLEPDKKSN